MPLASNERFLFEAPLVIAGSRFVVIIESNECDVIRTLRIGRHCGTIAVNATVIFPFPAHYAGAIMHMVDVDLLSRDVCQNRVLGAESHVNVAGNVICGKPQNENNMCQADVGAPLACYDGNGAYHIAGIYSQDTGCLSTNQVSRVIDDASETVTRSGL